MKTTHALKLRYASLFLATSALAQVVPWTAETTRLPSNQAGDPTFVFRPGPADAGVSLVIGTDPGQLGAHTWSPDGTMQQAVSSPTIVHAADARDSLVVFSSRFGSLLTFEASSGGLTQLQPLTVDVPTAGQLALAHNPGGGFQLWVDNSSQTVQHYTLSSILNGEVQYTALPSITVPQTPSGLAIDDRTGRLYVAQPTLGILAVEPDGGAGFLVSIDAGQLGAWVGGLDLFPAADGGAVLFSAAPAEQKVIMHILSGAQASFQAALQFGPPDGGGGRVQSRFLDVFESPLPGFPKGLLVLQDELTASYKVVSLVDVAAVTPLPEPPVPRTDGGVDGGVDGGRTTSTPGETGGHSSGPGASAQPLPPCSCGGPLSALPLLSALLLLSWIRRLRTRP